MTTTTEAYAKVNFTLEVFSKRADGYHALRSLVMPVTLADTLEFAPATEFSSDTGYADDLCVKAALELQKAVGGVRQPYSVKVVKNIPAGGGLGGGSADAAATLAMLNGLWGAGLSPRELAEVGARVGSDVPALVLARPGMPVVMEGRGELVTGAPNAARRLSLVLVNPGVFSSTAEVFRASNSRVTDDHSILYNMLSALESGGLEEIASALMNDLDEPAARLHPEIAAAKAALSSAGALGATMSGSGSTVFGLVPSEAAGREIAASLRAKGYLAWSAWTHCPVV